MIDMHSHLLPSLDDGARSLRVAVEMLAAAKGLGIRTIVATPHLTAPLNHDYADQVRAAFRRVDQHARAMEIELLSGFEVRLSPDLPSRLRAGEPITLGKSKIVLVDLACIDWPYFADYTLFNIQISGFQVILAHPERYPNIQRDPKIGLNLAQRGIAMQVTIGSFSGVFGKQAKRAAEALVKMGAVHLVATDAHSAGHRMAAVPEGLRRLNALVGRENLIQLTVDAPKLLLNEGELLRPIAATPKRGFRTMFTGFRS